MIAARLRPRCAARWLCLLALCGGLLLLLAGPARGQSAGRGAASDAFADALSLYQDRLYGAAQEAFAGFYATYPEDARAAEALFYEARALLALGQGGAAARRLEQLESAYPVHPLAERAQLRLGRYFFEQGSDNNARRTLRRILARGNAEPERAAEARFLLGALARRAGQPAEALEQFRTVGERYPDAEAAPRALYQAAAVHLEQDRPADAADALERLARRYPDAPQASSLGLALAEVYFDLGRDEAVLRELRQQRDALTSDADRARALFLRAEALRRQDRPADAAASYQRYLERFPQAADALAARYGRARALYRQQDYARAAPLFERVAEAPGGDASNAQREQAAFFAAASRAGAGEAQAAADAFGTFLERFPESARRAEAQYRRGRALLDAGQPAAAARVLARAAGSDGFAQRAEARYLRSRALRATERYDDALAALESALKAGLPPDLQAQARFEQGRLLLDAGQAAAAAGVFAAYRDRFPEGAQAAAARYWEAEARYRDGALPQAAAGYQRYLQRNPDGDYAGAARYNLGWASFQQENYEAAARVFERFLEMPAARDGSTYRSDALLRLGDSYYALRRFAEAEAVYARAGREATREARDYALYQTGQTRSRADDPAGAIDAWQALVEDFPESELRAEARYQIGQAHFQEERYTDAIDAWRTLLETEPRDALAAKAQYGIGDALYNAGRQGEAARAYRAVLEDYPESAFASDAARGVALAAESGAGAVDSLAGALPADAAAEVRFRRAETLYQRGQADAARQAFQRFVRASTREDLLPQAYYYLGMLYADAGQPREAEGYLRQVLRDYPGSDRRADAADRLGTLFLKQDAPQRALDVFRQMQDFAAEGDARTQARARYGQGRALAALGRSADAEARFREAVEQAPSGAAVAQRARLGRARLYADTGRPDEAQALFRRVAEESRGAAGAEALYRLGALLRAQGQPEAAVEELSRLPDLFAGFPDWIARSLLEQARAFHALDRPGQASRLYDRLQEDFAGTEAARTARQEQEAL